MNMIQHPLLFLLLVFSFIFINCGKQNRDRENYGDLTQNQNSVKLIDPSKHTGGYGRNQCLVCHNTALNVHRGASSIINIEAMNQAILNNNGEGTYCMTCHGTNGSEEQAKP